MHEIACANNRSVKASTSNFMVARPLCKRIMAGLLAGVLAGSIVGCGTRHDSAQQTASPAATAPAADALVTRDGVLRFPPLAGWQWVPTSTPLVGELHASGATGVITITRVTSSSATQAESWAQYAQGNYPRFTFSRAQPVKVAGRQVLSWEMSPKTRHRAPAAPADQLVILTVPLFLHTVLEEISLTTTAAQLEALKPQFWQLLAQLEIADETQKAAPLARPSIAPTASESDAKETRSTPAGEQDDAEQSSRKEPAARRTVPPTRQAQDATNTEEDETLAPTKQPTPTASSRQGGED